MFVATILSFISGQKADRPEFRNGGEIHSSSLLGLLSGGGELAIVFGDRILIAGGNSRRIGIANCAALAFVELLADLQFQRVDLRRKLLVHRLQLLGITLEAIRIESAHLVNQRLYLSAGFGAFLHGRFHLIQDAHFLIDFALRILRSRASIRRDRLTLDVCVAGVPAAEVSALPLAAARIAHRPSLTIADALGIAAVLTTGAVLVAHAGGLLSTALATSPALALLALLTLSLALALSLSLSLPLAVQCTALLALTRLSLLPLPLTLPLL